MNRLHHRRPTRMAQEPTHRLVTQYLQLRGPPGTHQPPSFGSLLEPFGQPQNLRVRGPPLGPQYPQKRQLRLFQSDSYLVNFILTGFRLAPECHVHHRAFLFLVQPLFHPLPHLVLILVLVLGAGKLAHRENRFPVDLFKQLKPLGFKLGAAPDGDDIAISNTGTESIHIGDARVVVGNTVGDLHDLKVTPCDGGGKWDPIGRDSVVEGVGPDRVFAHQNRRWTEVTEQGGSEYTEICALDSELGSNGTKPIGNEVVENPIGFGGLKEAGDIRGSFSVLWEIIMEFGERKLEKSDVTIRRKVGKAIDVSWGGYESDEVTLLSYKLGKLKVRDNVAKRQPWEHHNVKLLVVSRHRLAVETGNDD
ncbi:hypothetical protein G2W53_020449 [Senna tora]|uniref:Uncharacterized protein n=1 Tax=Senna tora TaxID=362788 RepID=A0A834U0E4_9FABA|nr:hypothetical protein G2W53_020449 [Senna tora]